MANSTSRSRWVRRSSHSSQAARCRSSQRQYPGAKVAIGLGQAAHDISAWRTSYRDAVQALDDVRGDIEPTLDARRAGARLRHLVRSLAPGDSLDDLNFDYLVDAVFNYPTFSEAYKVAALDVTNKMRALSQFRR